MVQGRTRKLRVGFILDPDSGNWIGGVHYFKNLFYAISADPTSCIQPVILTVDVDACTRHFPQVEVISLPFTVKSKISKNISRKIFQKPSLSSYILRDYVIENEIDILSHTYVQERVGIPTIGWIPDLQEKHYPEFFSSSEIKFRDRSTLNHVSQNTCVIFSSQSAKEDATRCYPEYQSKYVVLSFVASFFGTDYSREITSEVVEKYNLPDNYFYCPNQFWKHKNHVILVNSLKKLRDEGITANIVCSGSSSDYRNPMYFDELFSQVRALGLEDQFTSLGQIPYEDVLSLMFHAKAMINPSFFEGWSTSVEEAKSLEIPVILSDIPVHREQNPSDVLFFDPRSAEDLAICLQKSLQRSKDWQMRGGRERLSDRTIQFAKNYESIILETLEKYSPPF